MDPSVDPSAGAPDSTRSDSTYPFDTGEFRVVRSRARRLLTLGIVGALGALGVMGYRYSVGKRRVLPPAAAAQQTAADDKARREVIDARNQADSLAYSVEKTIGENRDRLPATDVSRVENAIAAVREAVKGEDLQAIRAASDELQKASHAIAEQLYKQSQANAANAQAAQSNNDDVKEGEVVDA